MMIKFLARGTGSAAAAADYLTRDQLPAHDHDQDREPEKNPEEVKVLRGNPHQVADVADALQFEHKYTSGVIAWAPEDKPSDAQIGRVVAYSTSQKETRHEKILGHATDRPATAPVDSTATGVTATKGFDLARDLIGGLPELDDQIGGATVGISGQASAERVATDVRDLQSFVVNFRDNRYPYAASPHASGRGRCFRRP